jgi:hypothetical protein
MDGGKSGCHEWIIEFDQEPDNQVVFNQVLDQTLRSINSDYDAKRYKDMVLTPPKINVVQKDTFIHGCVVKVNWVDNTKCHDCATHENI